MKKLFKRPVFYISLFQILTSIFLIYSIFDLDVLSIKFLIPIIIFIIIIDSLIIFFLFKKIKIKGVKYNKNGIEIDQIKKAKNKKMTLTIISLIVSLIFIVSSILCLQLSASMKNMFKNKSVIEYSVLVKKKSKYKEIEDLNDKIIGFYEEDKYSDQAKKKLKKKAKADYIGYSSINELKYALLNDEIDGMMIMDSYLEMDDDSEEIEEIENSSENEDSVSEEVSNENDDKILKEIEKFDNKSKVIYHFKIIVDNSKKTKSIDLKKGSFVIYVSGQDSYDNSVSETSRSDVNMLMVVNVKTKQILLLTIPRDYYIKIKSKGAYDKLTHISIYGPEEAANSLGDILDVDVDYFIKFNFTTFMKATEYLLPLDVYSDYEFTTSVYDRTIGNCYTFYEGYNHITDGKQALQFVRARKNFSEGDRQRGINQTRFLRAVIKKAFTPSVLVKYNKILKSMDGTFLTNIDDDSIKNIVKYILNHNGKFNISSISLDGSDAHRSTYSGGSQALYVMIPNQDTIDDAKIQVKAVLDGKKPDIEKDASELVSSKKSHKVTNAPTNYAKSYVTTTPKKNNTPIVIETPKVVEEKEDTSTDADEDTPEVVPDDNPSNPDITPSTEPEEENNP